MSFIVFWIIWTIIAVLIGQKKNIDLGTSLTAYSSTALPVTAAARSVTIDTTVARPNWGVGCAVGTSGGGNGVTVDLFTCKILNVGKTS